MGACRLLSSLRSRLILLVLLGAIPFLILVAYSSFEQRASAAYNAKQDVMQLAKIVADEQSRLVNKAQLILSMLAEMPPIQDKNIHNCSPFLESILNRHSPFLNIGVAHLNGDIFCSAHPLKKAINIADRAYFQRTLKSGGFAIGDYQIGRITKEAVLVYSSPVLDTSKRLTSVLFASLPLTWMNQTISDHIQPSGSVISVIDRNSHKLLSRYPESGIHISSSLSGSSLIDALHKVSETGLKEIVGLDGVKRFTAFRLLQKLPDDKEIFISVSVPAEEIYAEPNAILTRNLTTLIIVVTLMLLLAWYGSDALILKQIKSLLTATKKIASGELATRIEAPDNLNEISQLSHEFNHMAATIQQRNHASKQAMDLLQQSEQRLNSIMTTAHDAILLLDNHGKIRYWNPAAEHIFGYSEAQVLGKDGHLLLLPERHRQDSIKRFKKFAKTGRSAMVGRTIELIALRQNGEEFPVELSTSAFQIGKKWNAVGIMRDISERKQKSEKLRRSSRALAVIHASNSLLIHLKEEQALLSSICQNIISQSGYRFAWIGIPQGENNDIVEPAAWAGEEKGFLAALTQHPDIDELAGCPVRLAIQSGIVCLEKDIMKVAEQKNWHREAIKRGFRSVIGLPLIHDLQTLGALIIYSTEVNAFDADEVQLLAELANDLAYGVSTIRLHKRHQKAEEKIAYHSYHDRLTGLPNRDMMTLLLDETLAKLHHKGGTTAILFINLDNFKLVNDTFGHSAGDKLLQQVTERLNEAIRDHDVVARQSGDEFIIMLKTESKHTTETGIDEDATIVAQRILTAMQSPFRIGEHEVYISASIGISLFPQDAKSSEELIQLANTAMYRAKQLGRNNYQFFSMELSQRQQHKILLATQLHKALDNKEFILYYQPVIDLSNGRMVGVEALIRWQQSSGKLISPDDFIPVAEDTGMILAIGEWVLREGCRQRRTWADKNIALDIALNVSVKQMWNEDIVNTVLNIIRETGISEEMIELEITESAMVIDSERIEATIAKFKESKVKIALDDFGTGYSSLNRLKHLPFHKLKIDKSFVDDTPSDMDNVAIVSATIQMAKSLGLCSLAEGIETLEQYRYLKNIDCDFGQGYYFSKPVPAEEIERMYTENHHWKI